MESSAVDKLSKRETGVGVSLAVMQLTNSDTDMGYSLGSHFRLSRGESGGVPRL